MNAQEKQRILSWISASLGLMRILLCWAMAMLRGRKVVCISMTEHMGDIFAAEPISRRVRSLTAWPVSVIWVTSHRYADIPRMFSAVNGVVSVRNLGSWIYLKRMLLHFRVYDLHLHRRQCGKTNLFLRNPTANPAINGKNYYNQVNLLGLQCSNAGLVVFDEQPRLEFAEDTAAELRDLLGRPYIVVHVRSNELDREWNDEKWRQLIGSLHAATGYLIVEVGLERPVISMNKDSEWSLVGGLTLKQLCAVIRDCALFVGVDSGPAHIANTFQVPSLILIGWYRIFRCYVPYSGWLANTAEVSLLHHAGPLSELPTETALQRALRVLGKIGSCAEA